MAAGGQQQTAGVTQIAAAMDNIHQAAVQSLASTRQTEHAAQNLTELSSRLTDTVAKYELQP
jgi:methyl-accepting chemotaxis protein